MARPRETEAPSRVSYAAAGVSGLLIVALVAYLIWNAIRPDSPAAIVAEAVPAEAWTAEGMRYVPIDVRNAGGRTAAAVGIGIELGGRIVGETTIDFLAGGERRRIYIAVPAAAESGAVTWGRQAAGGEVAGAGAASGGAVAPQGIVRVLGFQEP